MTIPTVERRRFKVGKYDIIAHPIPASAHMLRYTVFVGGKRIGATVSVPTESDCRFLEKPPVVPPLKTRIEPWDYDRAMYKRRNEVERLFRRLKGYRRIFSRFEKLDVMFIGFISFALIADGLRLC